MNAKPFLLDPEYEGLLDSSAFRERFATDEKILDQTRRGCCILALPLVTLIGLGLYALFPYLEVMACTVLLCFATVVPATVITAVHIIDVWRFLMQRRLAWYGELMPGTLLVARRVMQSLGVDEGDIVVVEVEYRARTSSGVLIVGKQTRQRDDLLNAELPEPGTPVWVLILSETRHAIL